MSLSRASSLASAGCDSAGAAHAGAWAFSMVLEDALAVEWLEQIVDCVDLKGADGVLVEGGGEDDLRQRHLAVEQFFEDGESVEAGHLDVEEDDVGLVGADELYGFDAVGALRENFDSAGALEEILQLLTCEGFIIDDEVRSTAWSYC